MRSRLRYEVPTYLPSDLGRMITSRGISLVTTPYGSLLLGNGYGYEWLEMDHLLVRFFLSS